MEPPVSRKPLMIRDGETYCQHKSRAPRNRHPKAHRANVFRHRETGACLT